VVMSEAVKNCLSNKRMKRRIEAAAMTLVKVALTASPKCFWTISHLKLCPPTPFLFLTCASCNVLMLT
jgi:hypothetical protein